MLSYFSSVPVPCWQTRVWPQQCTRLTRAVHAARLRTGSVHAASAARAAARCPGPGPSAAGLPHLMHVPHPRVLDRVINQLHRVRGPIQRPPHGKRSLQCASQLRPLGANRQKSVPGKAKKHYTDTEYFAVFGCKLTLAVYQSQHTKRGVTAQTEHYATTHIASSCFEEQPLLLAKYCVNASYRS